MHDFFSVRQIDWPRVSGQPFFVPVGIFEDLGNTEGWWLP